MKICIAQTNPVKADISKNMAAHIEFIKIAARKNADLIVFPELSLTGYEPERARQLALTKSDKRLDVLQELSDQHTITIFAGLPTIENSDVFISMVILQPKSERIVYSKQYLYVTEQGVFTAAHNPLVLNFHDGNIVAPAICFELSNEEHSKNAFQNNATVYIASVLNSVSGVNSDLQKLSHIAAKYKMTTFMANYVGHSGGYDCAGKSSAWNTDGELVAQLDDKLEGLLIYDTETKQYFKEYLTTELCR